MTSKSKGIFLWIYFMRPDFEVRLQSHIKYWVWISTTTLLYKLSPIFSSFDLDLDLMTSNIKREILLFYVTILSSKVVIWYYVLRLNPKITFLYKIWYIWSSFDLDLRPSDSKHRKGSSFHVCPYIQVSFQSYNIALS